jgi:hypothetical protein
MIYPNSKKKKARPHEVMNDKYGNPLPVRYVGDADMLHELLVRDSLDSHVGPGVDHNQNLQGDQDV